MAYSVTSLAWGLLEFKDAYVDAGQLNYMYDCIRWPLDFLLKCHVTQYEFYGQVGWLFIITYALLADSILFSTFILYFGVMKSFALSKTLI